MSAAIQDETLEKEDSALVKRQECADPVPVSTRFGPTTIRTTYVSYSGSEPVVDRRSADAAHLAPRYELIQIPITLFSTYVTTVPVETIYSCPEAPPELTISDSTSSERSTSSSVPPPRSSSPPPPRSSSPPPPRSSSLPPPSSSSLPPRRSSSLPPRTSSIPPPSSVPPRRTSSIPPPTPPPTITITPTRTSTSTTTPSTTPGPNVTSSWPCSSYIERFDSWRYGTWCVTSSTSTNSSISWPCSSYAYSLEDWEYGTWCLSSTTNTTSWPCSSYVSNAETWVGVPCTTNSTSSWPCSSFDRSSETWIGVPCTSSFNTTSSIPPRTSGLCSSSDRSSGWFTVPCTTSTTSSWPCSSFDRSSETWIGVPCTSSTNTTSSTPPRTSGLCSSSNRSSGWFSVPCTSSNTTSIPSQTVSWPCSSYVNSLESWTNVPCTSSVDITTTTTSTSTTTTTSTTTSVTLPPICSSWVTSLERFITVPCTTTTIITSNATTPSSTITSSATSATSSACSSFVDSLDMWVPCTQPSRTSHISSQITSFVSNTTSWSSATSFASSEATVSSFNGTSASFSGTSRSSSDRSFSATDISFSRTGTSSGETSSSSESTGSTEILLPTGASSDMHTTTDSQTGTGTIMVQPTSRASLGSSNTPTTHSSHSLATTRQTPSSPRPSTQPDPEPSSRPSSRPSPPPNPPTRPGSTALPSPTSIISFTRPSTTRMLTSAFLVPSGTNQFLIPSASNTTTPIRSGLHGSALAGAIIGGILGAVGLLGIGVFLIRTLGGGKSAADLFGGSGGAGYERASGGGDGSNREGGMSERRHEAPDRQPSLRNRFSGGAGGSSGPGTSWTPYAYAGAAAAGAVASNNHQRGRGPNDSNTGGRYADGGIPDERTPDAHQARYADGGLAGPDSYYDSDVAHARGYGADANSYGGHNSFEPYRDLPLDSNPTGSAGPDRQDISHSGGDGSAGPNGSTGVGNPSGSVASGGPTATQGDNWIGVSGSANSDGTFGTNQSSQPTPTGQQGPTGERVPDGQHYHDPFDGPYYNNPIMGDSRDGPPTDTSYQTQLPVHNQTDIPRAPYWSWDGDPPAVPGPNSVPGDAGGSSSVPQRDPTSDMQHGNARTNDAVAEGPSSLADPGVPDLPKGLSHALERAGTLGGTRDQVNSRDESPLYKAGGVQPLRVGKRASSSEVNRSKSAATRSSLPPYYEGDHV